MTIVAVLARQLIERNIVESVIREFLENGGLITVNDGEEDVLKNSTSPSTILEAMFSTDSDTIFVSFPEKSLRGWVEFIYGNDGFDVLSNNTTNLESYLLKTQGIIDAYSDSIVPELWWN